VNSISRFKAGFRLALPLLLVLCAGCGTVEPGAEGVLAGTWELTKDDDPGGQKYVLTFDAFGNLTAIATVNGNTTVTTSNPSGTTTVAGQTVTIKTSQDNLKFVGTFNAGFTVATGTQFTEWEWFDTTTTIDEGEATLTKTG
jgi:YD repeat-containing protein